MRLLGRGLTRKEGVTWRCPRGCLSVAAVLPPPSRWQHSPTVPSLGCAGLGEWGQIWPLADSPSPALSAVRSVLGILSSSTPPHPLLLDMVGCSSFLIQPEAGKSWGGLGSHCI